MSDNTDMLDGIDLVNDDCIHFLSTIEDKSVDLVLIDPPYQISRQTNFASGDKKGTDVDRFRVSMDFGRWDKNFYKMKQVIEECYRVLKKGGTLICFYDLWKITELKEYLENAKFVQLRFIEWIKTNPVPLNSSTNYLTNAREVAITATKGGKPTFNSTYDNGVYKFPIYQGKDRIHPTQKPTDLISKLILKHSNVDDLVLDCFSGSGTTAVSCLLTNRRFIGCELDTGYYYQSLKRLIDMTK